MGDSCFLFFSMRGWMGWEGLFIGKGGEEGGGRGGGKEGLEFSSTGFYERASD